jgi:hypothetical protein
MDMNIVMETLHGRILSDDMLGNLRDGLNRHHVEYPDINCDGTLLEQRFSDALKNTKKYFVDWEPKSHRPFDIGIQDCITGDIVRISNKAGQIINKGRDEKKPYLRYSGYRLGKAKEFYTDDLDFNKVNSLIIEYNPDTIWLCPYDTKLDQYNFYTIDPQHFHEPIVQYNQVFKNGITASIRKSMSSQVWWDVPLELCDHIGTIQIVRR